MLKLTNISKRFKNLQIIDNLNYTFKEGNIYLIRGRNGIGKTVLLKIICGLMNPNDGAIEYVSANTEHQDPEYGIIIETPVFWNDKTGYETLKFLASIKNKIGDKEINDALEKVGLENVKNKNVKKYSLGMKQRLAIAQAIMENPLILLFDEPINSLDDDGIAVFKNIVLNEKKKNKIIIIVSHMVEELNDICDKIIYLENGTLKEK